MMGILIKSTLLKKQIFCLCKTSFRWNDGHTSQVCSWNLFIFGRPLARMNPLHYPVIKCKSDKRKTRDAWYDGEAPSVYLTIPVSLFECNISLLWLSTLHVLPLKGVSHDCPSLSPFQPIRRQRKLVQCVYINGKKHPDGQRNRSNEITLIHLRRIPNQLQYLFAIIPCNAITALDIIYITRLWQ